MSTELRLFFSPCRLASYQLPGEEWPVALARYQWNLQLAEAMLPSLNYLEVGLRNGVNSIVARLYGDSWLLVDWLSDPPPNLQLKLELSRDDRAQIESIKADILKHKGRPATHHDVLAQLNFGFWVAMFQKKRKAGVWSRGGNPIADVFPNMPVAIRSIDLIFTRMHTVKTLRNRIAHHEPIWKQTPTALDVHQNCIDLIRAMSSAAADELAKIDRFASVYSAGPSKVSL
jgi:hypothetical protein